MADVALSITDAGLLEQLKKSYIAGEQKKQLEPLIPAMTEAERKELLALIEQSKAEGEKVEKEYQESLGNLNKEYMGKMEKFTAEQSTQARKELEKMDTEDAAAELQAVEGEIAVTPAVTPTVAKPIKVKKGHALRNLFLILFFLFLLAGAALYAINYLSTN